jgi:predicted nuclease with TOPRIM domain
MQSLLTNLRNLSIIIFFITLSWGVIRTVDILDNQTTNALIIAQNTSFRVTDELKNVTGQTNSLVNIVNHRLYSIEQKTFNRLESIETNTFQQIENVNNNLEQITGKVILIGDEHEKLAKETTQLVKRSNELLDCRYNDLCIPNLMTDVMIDTRNMVRDGSKTFQMVNSNIPKIVTDVDKVSTSLAEGFPKLIHNSSEVSANINRITRPKWYDKAISWGVNGSLLYFNINRGRLIN